MLLNNTKYTDMYYQIVNKLWKTVKPFVEHLDAGKKIDNATQDKMIKISKSFARNNFEKAIKGDPDLEMQINEICYCMLQAVTINAQREGLLEHEKDEIMKGQIEF